MEALHRELLARDTGRLAVYKIKCPKELRPLNLAVKGNTLPDWLSLKLV